MASLGNAYAALNAIGGGAAPSASSKRKKKPAKKAPAAEEGPSAPPDAGSGPAVVAVKEACAILDKAARTFKSGSDRLKLWRDWLKQVGRGRVRWPRGGALGTTSRQQTTLPPAPPRTPGR